jgi:hypothetical protein
MSKPITAGRIKKVLDAMADSVGKKRDGSFVIRRGFYYRHGADAETFKMAVCERLNDSGIDYSIKDYGEHYTTFRGGASINAQSHWFVEIWINPTIA